MKERWKEELYEIADLERARLLLYPLAPEHGADERVATAIAAARREGAEEAKNSDAYFLEHASVAGYRRGAAEMRERARQYAFDQTSDDPQLGGVF